MDYKINGTAQQIECNENMLPAFPTLKYGQIPNGPLVFDATLFSKNNPEMDYKTFQRTNKRYIEAIAQYTENTKTSELFYINRDGHILIHHELTFLYIAFVEPELAVYFNGLIGEIMAEGVAYSDDFIVSLAAQRVPSDILQKIIDSRNETA